MQVVCSIGDVILYKTTDGDLGAGEVWINFELEGELAVLVQAWNFVSEGHGAAAWEVHDELQLVFSNEILDTLIWTPHSDTQVKTLLPAHSR